MRTRPLVKVCGITSTGDARMALRMGADYLGVIFYENSPRHVGPETLTELVKTIPDGRRVMVDVAPSNDVLLSRLDMGFDFCQIHFDLETTPPETVEGWAGTVGPSRLWLAPKAKPGTLIPAHVIGNAGTVVIDSYKKDAFGGTGITGSWTHFAELAKAQPETRFMLAGGLGPDNLLEALRESHAEMVDLNSGVESAPGIKDQIKLSRAFLAVSSYAAEGADA